MTDSPRPALPTNIDAEQAVLGSLLIDPRAIIRVAPFLEPGDFYLPSNAAIYSAMLSRFAADEPGDVVMLSEALRRSGALDDVGGPAYLLSLTQLTPTSVHVEHYARIVERLAIFRRLVAAGETLSDLGYRAAGGPDEALDEADRLLMEIRRTSAIDIPVDNAARWSQLMDQLLAPPDPASGKIPTCLRPLDALIEGLGRGDLIILAGDASTGKTSLAVTIAHHVAVKLGIPVYFISLEMPDKPVRGKFIAVNAQLPYSAVMSHALNPFQAAKIREATARLASAPLEIVAAREWTATRIRAETRRVHEQRGSGLVVVDYFQFIAPEGKHQNRNLELAAISYALKSMALELNAAVLCNSATNRPPQGWKGEPDLNRIRDTGQASFDADAAYFLYPPPGLRVDQDQAVQPMVLKVDKNRLGRRGRVPLGLLGDRMEFVELDPVRFGDVIQRVVHGEPEAVPQRRRRRRDVDDDYDEDDDEMKF